MQMFICICLSVFLPFCSPHISFTTLLIQEWGPEAIFFLRIRLQRGEAEERGIGEIHSCEAKCLKVFNIRYETTLIFNEHARSYFSGEIQSRGVEWVIFGELWRTWLEYDTHFGKKDASPSRAIDAAAAMATGPWIKAMWIIMGWLTHNTRPVSLRKLSLN